MNDALLLTLTTDLYAGMVADHEPRHAAYCAKWGFDRRVVCGLPSGYEGAFHWYKIDLIVQLLRETHYDTIVWLDADAMIADFETDLRTALPAHAHLGLCVHPYPWSRTIWHWNVGVMYIRRCPASLLFFFKCRTLAGSILDTPDFKEQAVVNYMLLDDRNNQNGFITLGHEWNANVHNQPSESARVVAWHGFGTSVFRCAAMRNWAQEHPYGIV